MGSSTKIQVKNSWTQLTGVPYSSKHNFIDNMVYSPDQRYGLTMNSMYANWKKSVLVNFRVVEMATGEVKYFDFKREELKEDVKVVTFYFITSRQFVLVVFNLKAQIYEQRSFSINNETEEIERIGCPVLTSACSTDRLAERLDSVDQQIGCTPVNTRGKKFLVLPSVHGFVLAPWNPSSFNPSKANEQGPKYINFAFTNSQIEDYEIANTNYYICGSRIFFSLFKSNSEFGQETIQMDYFDKFAVLDLESLDLKEDEIVLTEDTAKLEVVDLKHSTPGEYKTSQQYYWNQNGQYLTAVEVKQGPKKREATQSKIYVMDLANLTTSIVSVRTRKNSLVTIYNDSVLIWRSRQQKLEFYDEDKKHAKQMADNVYEFKTLPITGFGAPSLHSLAKNSLLLGRSGIYLDDVLISRFFN